MTVLHCLQQLWHSFQQLHNVFNGWFNHGFGAVRGWFSHQRKTLEFQRHR
uniref:Uncharacterized protein n=1 Tax=Cucumis melo TaxID=3656 RepID=A0A9I9E910_CUCME